MAELTIKVEGLYDLRKVLKQISDEAPKAITTANKNAATQIATEAARNAPVRTGKLRSSVKALATQTSARMKAGGTNAVPYAPAVHWGTGPREGLRGPHNIKPNPFLWNARQKLAAEVRKDYEDELSALIDRLVR